MLPYWLMFLLPALAAIAARPNAAMDADGTRRVVVSGVWVFVALAITALAGFRLEVGGDWFNYMRHFNLMTGETWVYAFSKSEFSHWALNKFMSDVGWGMTGVNVVYAAVFAIGFTTFVRTLPRPWLALAAAVPYLIIVVSMGYSRQAVALGFALIGLVALRRERFVVFALWVLVGATFHNSAVFLIPIAGLTTTRRRLQGLAVTLLFAVVGYEVLLSDRLENLIEVYVERQLTDSQGALIRLSMNALVAFVFLNYRKVFLMSDQERRLWTVVSLLCIVMWLAYFATGLSTALDRMALYLIPLQMVVAAHFPDAVGRRGGQNTGGVAIVLGYYAAVQFVWLNFATHARYWLPYQMGIDL